MAVKDPIMQEHMPFFEHSDRLLAILGPDGRIMRANRSWKDHLERVPGGLVGRTFGSLAHPEDRAHVEDAIKDIRRTPEGTHALRCRMLREHEKDTALLVEWRFVTDDGRTLAFGDPLPLASGVTERDMFFELSMDLLCVAGSDGYFHDLNPAWSHTLGWTLDELKSRPNVDFVHPDDRQRTIDEGKRIARGATSFRFQNRYRTKGGRYRWLMWTTVATKGGDRVFAVARDITAQKNAEEALKGSEERFRSLAETANDPILSADATSRITFFNRAAERVFGYRADDVIGQSLTMLMPEEYREAHLAGLSRFAATGESRIVGRTIELVARRQNGENFPIELNISHWKSGDKDYFTAILRDITNRKEAAAKVREYADRMRRSNEELEQFASVASHDLQEPLGVVRSYVQLLERRLKDVEDERARKYMHFIADGTERMQRLIEDLLSYSRVGTRGKEPEPTGSERALHQALEQLGLRVEEADAKIDIGPLPRVMADEGQLVRLFQNLVSNAVKYRDPERRPHIEITAGPSERAGWVQFSVHDNGIGIAPEHHQRIFQIFQRLHGRGEYEGTGIGLAICKKIVERHGGELWVESDVGKGSTFSFTMQEVPA